MLAKAATHRGKRALSTHLRSDHFKAREQKGPANHKDGAQAKGRMLTMKTTGVTPRKNPDKQHPPRWKQPGPNWDGYRTYSPPVPKP